MTSGQLLRRLAFALASTAVPMIIVVGCGVDSVTVAPLPEGTGTPGEDPSSSSGDDGTNNNNNNNDNTNPSGTKDGGTNNKADANTSKPDSSTPPVTPPTDPDDPALNDPARPSLPYECAGTPLTAAETIEHVAQGSDRVLLANGKNWNNSANVVRVVQVGRKCHPATGCAPWQVDTLTLIIGTSRHDYPLSLWVNHAGVLQLVENLFNAPTPIKTIQTGDFQAQFLAVPSEAVARRYKTRITRLANGNGCFSAASTVSKNAPAADGSTFEYFYWGKAEFAAAIPRVAQPPRTPWASHCPAGATPATNAVIATWFPPGGTTKNFPTGGTPGNSRREISQQCHPITGCTAWTESFAPSDELYGLKTTPTGFAARFDGNVSVPVINGKITGTHSQLGAVDGIVTSAKCVSYDAKSVTQYTYTGAPSISVEQHLEERNDF